MPRRKRLSTILQHAELRATGLQSLAVDVSSDCSTTLKILWEKISQVREQQCNYNSLLATVDQVYSELLEAEIQLSKLSDRALQTVATVYGHDSVEYAIAQGIQAPGQGQASNASASGLQAQSLTPAKSRAMG